MLHSQTMPSQRRMYGYEQVFISIARFGICRYRKLKHYTQNAVRHLQLYKQLPYASR